MTVATDIVTSIDWGTILAPVFAALSAILAAWLGKVKAKLTGETARADAAETDLETYDKLMTAEVRMDDAQTDLLASGKVSDEAWRMSDSAFDSMVSSLASMGTYVNEADLRQIVAAAEADYQVDYAIIVTDKEGNTDDTAKHVYVSYGIGMICDAATAVKNVGVSGAPTYHITRLIRLSDNDKHLIVKEEIMGHGTESVVMDQINAAEAAGTVTYTITGTNQCWEISNGKIVGRYQVSK